MRKYRFLFAGLFVLLFVMVGCQANDNGEKSVKQNEANMNESTADVDIDEDVIPIVTMEMEDGDEVTIELYPSIAPNTVNNFIALVEEGFYDGLIFHRVIPGFMVQGGDPEGTGMGGPGYEIKGEFSNNGFANRLKHDRGVLSMARSQDPDSAGSQFFIMTAQAEHLDDDYAAFGKVSEGMDVIDEIVEVERDGSDKPKEDQVIKKMTVDLQGYEPKEVEKQ
ncbi:MAG TPA: peptidylprolyl isomerase [Pseudogracilibacillus sp.]|nr:peptidylprolyl isomerase [Pseudogracilibacillus sp.]